MLFANCKLDCDDQNVIFGMLYLIILFKICKNRIKIKATFSGLPLSLDFIAPNNVLKKINNPKKDNKFCLGNW